MSAPTVAEKGYTIREGLSGPTDAQHPFIEGVVNGIGVVTAFEYQPDNGDLCWLLATYPALFQFAGVARPTAVKVPADEARRWVELLTALYAKAVAA